jgi:hypothetical protein
MTTHKIRSRLKTYIESGYHKHIPFSMYMALRNVGVASALLFLTPVIEYNCKDIFSGTEIVCATKDKKHVFSFSKTGDKEEVAARKRYMKAKRGK